MAIDKVFIYLVRFTFSVPQLLVFESLDEQGFECPKGKVEAGESHGAAVHRELLEETGLRNVVIHCLLGHNAWEDEAQYHYLVTHSEPLPDRFEHRVTGDGEDAGLLYRFRWLPIDPALTQKLVQGCDRFVEQLTRDAHRL